jgi:hypothetical protein
MDHSLRGYLERCSTKELDAILNYVVNNYVCSPEETVRTIIAILEEREKDIKEEITPEMWASWEQYLEKAKQQQKQQEQKS